MIPAERERVAWQRAEERTQWERIQQWRGKDLGKLERRSKREWSELYGRQERQREQLAKDCRGVLGRFREESTAAGWKGQRDGLAVYDRYRGEDWDRLKRSASEERMEQVREFDGEQAYEKTMRAMEKADQEKASQEKARQVERSSKLPARKKPERRGPERGGPERDYGPSR